MTDRIPPYSVNAFLVAVGCLAAATGVRLVFSRAGASLPFATYFPAVMVAALIAGAPAAVLVIVGAVLTAWWAFIPPEYAFGPLDLGRKADMMLFVLASACIVLLAEWHRRTLARLKRYDQERQLLVQELEHRRRNTFAVIEAIVSNTLDDDPERAAIIAGRVRAILYTNDLIAQSATSSVLLNSLLLHEFAGYGGRFRTEGPELELSAIAARQLALVFHELVTNAAKHGALSASAGRVLISWRIEHGTVTLDWREEGGPPVSLPERHSFGSRLVVQCLKSLSGRIVPTFATEGLQCTITFRV